MPLLLDPVFVVVVFLIDDLLFLDIFIRLIIIIFNFFVGVITFVGFIWYIRIFNVIVLLSRWVFFFFVLRCFVISVGVIFICSSFNFVCTVPARDCLLYTSPSPRDA